MLNQLPFVELDLKLTQEWAYEWVGKAFDIVLGIFLVLFAVTLVQLVVDLMKGRPKDKTDVGEINNEIRKHIAKIKRKRR